MTEAERDQEIASIFAHGIVRLRTSGGVANDPTSQKPAESAQQGLEVSREMRLSVTSG